MAHRFLQLLILISLCLGFVACTQEPAQPTPIANISTATYTPRPIPLPTITAIFPTPEATQNVQQKPTETPTPSLSPTQQGSPTPSPTATQPPITSTPKPINLVPDYTLSAPQDITLSADGTIWAISANGVHTLTQKSDLPPQNDSWSDAVPLAARQFLPNDTLGRPWILAAGPQAAFYDPEQGWRVFSQAEGWQLAQVDRWRDQEIAPVLIDRRGDFWIANGRDGLHRYSEADKQWEQLTAEEIGFSSPPDPTTRYSYDPTAITDVVQDPFGNIWVSSCHIRRYPPEQQPEDPRTLTQEGAGIRIFNGREWDTDTQLPNRCILDLALAPDGRVWTIIAGQEQGDAGLRAFDFTQGGWVDLSPWTQVSGFQGEALVADSLHASDTHINIILQRRWYGEIWPSTIQRYMADGRWQTLLDGLDTPPYPLAVDQESQVWGRSTGFLVYGDKDRTETIFELGTWEFKKLIVDRVRNQLWVYGRPEPDEPFDIWRYDESRQ